MPTAHPRGKKSRPAKTMAQPALPAIPKSKGGRPSKFTQAIADRFFLIVATTTKSIRRICEEDPLLPVPSTIHLWMWDKPGFSEQYARAKQFQAELLFDEIIEIADTPKAGSIVTTKAGVTETKVADMTRHREIQIDARKWVLAKLNPKVYGEYLRVDESRKPALAELLEHFRQQAPQVPPGESD